MYTRSVASALVAILLGACAPQSGSLRFDPSASMWGMRAIEPREDATTLLPPGWKPIGTVSPQWSGPEATSQVPFYLAANDDVPGVLYVNANGPNEMFGWHQSLPEQVAIDVHKGGMMKPSVGGEVSPPPTVMITVSHGVGLEPHELGQGLRLGEHVLTAEHVVASLANPGARLGIDDRFVGYQIVARGGSASPPQDATDSVAEVLTRRMDDWALIAIRELVRPVLTGPPLRIGVARRGDIVHAVAYEPGVPGGGLASRTLRVIATVNAPDGRASYLLRSESGNIAHGWSGAFVGRLRQPNDWEFIAILNGSIEIEGEWYVTAARPPQTDIDQYLGGADVLSNPDD
jgi:hypothetical protein